MNLPDRLDPATVVDLVERAATGDTLAWSGLVDAYDGMLHSAVRRFRLGDSDANDVVQTAWLRLVQHIGAIEDASRVGAWLVTTARREAMRVVKHSSRVLPTEEMLLDRVDATTPDFGADLARGERVAVIRDLLDELNPRQRRLLDLLMEDPVPSYLEISARLGIPIGSIGPTRGRCLRRLTEVAESRGLDLMALAS